MTIWPCSRASGQERDCNLSCLPRQFADGADIRGANEIVILYNRRIPVGGDILTEIDGKPVNSPEEMRLALESKRAGDVAKVTLYPEIPKSRSP